MNLTEREQDIQWWENLPPKIKAKFNENYGLYETSDEDVYDEIKPATENEALNITQYLKLQERLILSSFGTEDIGNIDFVAYLKNINSLDMYEANLVDISPLSALANLKELSLFRNKITDISPLKNLINLEELDIWDNEISDITPLENLKNLKKLIIHKNPIKQQDIDRLQAKLPNCDIYFYEDKSKNDGSVILL